MKLRNYQQSAIDSVYHHLRTRDDNPCVVIPTGGGKTPVIARRKAMNWWRRRSPDPFPDSAQRAVEIAQAGGLATTHEIVVRKVAGEKFDRILKYSLGELPEAVEVTFCDFDESEVPF